MGIGRHHDADCARSRKDYPASWHAILSLLMKPYRLALSVLLALTSLVDAQNFVLNPGFEDGVLPVAGGFIEYSAGSTIGAWSVDYNSVDVHDTGHTTSHSGSASLDLAGSSVGGSISQVLNLTEGASYQLSLWVGNHWFHTDPNAYKVLDISWGGLSVASEIIPLTSTGPEISWSQLTYTVVATSSLTELRLATPTLNGGPLIDDISVTFVAVPEPSTVALATGLALLGGAGLRRWRGCPGSKRVS
jgi:hypothetical protein